MTLDLAKVIEPQVSLAKVIEPQIARMTLDLAKVIKVYQPQIARMTLDLAKVIEPQVSPSLARIVEPLLSELLAMEDLGPSSPNRITVLSTGDQRLRKLSDREVVQC